MKVPFHPSVMVEGPSDPIPEQPPPRLNAPPRTIHTPDGILSAIQAALARVIDMEACFTCKPEEGGRGNLQCHIDDEFVASCALPHPRDVLHCASDLDVPITGRRAELWAWSISLIDSTPYAMICIREDNRILFFLRVEARGGAPLRWTSPEVPLPDNLAPSTSTSPDTLCCATQDGSVGCTVSIEAFAWDQRAGWWTIPLLSDACFGRILSCAPDEDEDGMNLIISGVVGCVIGRTREGHETKLMMTMDTQSIVSIRSLSILGGSLAGAVAARLHARGMLGDRTR